MKSRLFPVVCGALVVACLGVPGDATVARRATPAGAAQNAAAFARGLAVARRGAAKNHAVTRPAGCASNGGSSFVGEPGSGSNFAGGGVATTGAYAGVAAGLTNEACDSQSFIGAGTSNAVGGDDASDSALIGAGSNNGIEGSPYGMIGAGFNNMLSDALASGIAAGSSNAVLSIDSFIGAGTGNSVVIAALDNDRGQSGFVGSGYHNAVTGNFSGIVAGIGNTDAAVSSAVVGGFGNSIAAGGQAATVAGGQDNAISGAFAFIGGGFENVASGLFAAVGGGYGNIATGKNAAVPGGALNTASGAGSFAAGYRSTAAHTGAFVWSDDAAGAAPLSSQAPNEFLARASGGFYLFSAANLATGVKLAPGSGSWSTLSDRAAKTAVARIDETAVLARLESMPVSEWSYTAQGTAVRHLGPMAQDFRAAFGLGEDDRHISTVDEEGVALAAIKALGAEVARKDRQLVALRRSLHVSQRANDAKFALLERRLVALERTHR